jgi:hypothetical protein
MRSRKLLSVLLAAGAALSVAPVLSGCTGRASYVVETETEPPPLRYERVVYRPGHIWVQGHWVRSGSHWRWRDGHYERERAGYVYEHGRWDHRGRSRVWVEGQWRPRASVTIQGRI